MVSRQHRRTLVKCELYSPSYWASNSLHIKQEFQFPARTSKCNQWLFLLIIPYPKILHSAIVLNWWHASCTWSHSDIYSIRILFYLILVLIECFGLSLSGQSMSFSTVHDHRIHSCHRQTTRTKILWGRQCVKFVHDCYTYPGGPPSQVHVVVSQQSVYCTVTGCTGLPGINAPALNGSNAFL